MDVAAPITQLLEDARAGDRDAIRRLLPLVYDDLHRISHRQLRAERDGHTLDTSALLHEAYLRLVDQTRAEWQDRSHFFAVASQAMRRILVDHARRYLTAKRGHGWQRVTLDAEALPADARAADARSGEARADTLVALDEALTTLAGLDERLGRVVECRFFGGLTEDETAEVLGVTARTVRRDWVKARGWLHARIHG